MRALRLDEIRTSIEDLLQASNGGLLLISRKLRIANDVYEKDVGYFSWCMGVIGSHNKPGSAPTYYPSSTAHMGVEPDVDGNAMFCRMGRTLVGKPSRQRFVNAKTRNRRLPVASVLR